MILENRVANSTSGPMSAQFSFWPGDCFNFGQTSVQTLNNVEIV